MTVTQTLRTVERKQDYPDVLKISLTAIPTPADMHEVQFIRSYGKTQNKQKFYLSAEDMLQFENVLTEYNKNFVVV
jgi:hypothetical protein